MVSIFRKAKIALQVFVPQRKKTDPKFALTDKEKDLRGKTIVFTGGTDGIGRCAVEILCDMGADVVLLARSIAKGEAAVDAINAKGKGRAVFEICDLSSMDSVRSCAESILAKHPKINTLVNCAGVNMLGHYIKYCVNRDPLNILHFILCSIDLDLSQCYLRDLSLTALTAK